MQRAQPADMIAGRPALQDEAVAQPARGPDPDPGTGHRVGVLVGGDRVVEGSAQMGQQDVDRHQAIGSSGSGTPNHGQTHPTPSDNSSYNRMVV